ncbi:MAG TPA: hypothetical protein VM324_06395 [Egibacteraceae bacterium]|jgi:hypothetical protein|nr:hypothetical protein [Egibacteraceae bacterium]
MRLLRTRQEVVFYADRLGLLLGADADRLSAMRTDADSVDLLTWNIFASLGTHVDEQWLAHRLNPLGGARVRAPVRLAYWTGRHREPLLRPSHAYVAALRERSAKAGGGGAGVVAFTEPVEVPVRIESPETLVLVDTVGHRQPRGAGGRERVLELIDAGLDHARRLGCSLSVAVVYPSGTPAAGDLSARINELRDPATLRAELGNRALAPVALRELSWQRLVNIWEAERDYLDLAGQPVKAFLSHLEQRGLR